MKSMKHPLRNIAPRRGFRLRAAATAAVLACAAVAAAGCGAPKSETMKTGDCGYFTEGNRSWDLQHRACNDPEAALVIVRGAAKERCPDPSYSWTSSGKPGKNMHVCTHVNAQIGDCFNDPEYNHFHLDRLRKVPCAPGAYQVNARVEKDEYGICDDAIAKYAETTAIRHQHPPISFCLNRIDA
ncbi:hypothetical protein [Nocardia sp. NPDC003963]